MFLKYIRDNSLSMPFSALSSSMKSSLSNIFLFFISNPLIFLKFVSVELILGHVTERVNKRMTTIRSKFRSNLGDKESVENNIISDFKFCLPSRTTISKQVFGNRMINWQNFIMSSIMFDWVWQSNYCCSNRSDFRTFD